MQQFMMPLHPLHPLHRDPAQTLQEDRKAIILADRLGFHDAFVGKRVICGEWDPPHRQAQRDREIPLDHDVNFLYGLQKVAGLTACRDSIIMSTRSTTRWSSGGGSRSDPFGATFALANVGRARLMI
jgi:hypothetical protein